MILDQDNRELEALGLHWSSLSEKDKNDIINEHANYISLSRRVGEVGASYSSNIISLMLLLFATLVMSLLGIDNRMIVLMIVSIQFVKTLLSKLVETSVINASKIARENLFEFLAKKVKKLKNV